MSFLTNRFSNGLANFSERLESISYNDETQHMYINDLPNEILWKIFDYILDGYNSSQGTPPIQMVCLRWRDLTNSHPMYLWTRSVTLLAKKIIGQKQYSVFYNSKIIGDMTILNLGDVELRILPQEFGNFVHLKYLLCNYNSLAKLPHTFCKLTSLNVLNFAANEFTIFPTVLCQLTNLTNLDLSYNRLVQLPAEIGNLTALRELVLCNNRLKHVPSEIGNLVNLYDFSINDNALEEIPAQIEFCTTLTKLFLHKNSLKKLSPEIGNLKKLGLLTLRSNPWKGNLPKELEKLSKLRLLELDEQHMVNLPSSMQNSFTRCQPGSWQRVSE